MKKQIFALSAIALATASAQAYPLLKSEQTGTEVDFTGSARIVWKSTSHKNQVTNGETEKNISITPWQIMDHVLDLKLNKILV